MAGNRDDRESKDQRQRVKAIHLIMTIGPQKSLMLSSCESVGDRAFRNLRRQRMGPCLASDKAFQSVVLRSLEEHL